MAKRSTSTSAFGVSKRESHDATGFYQRFTAPDLSADVDIAPHRAVDKLIVGDARHMDEVPDSSVALVVTSPPYFAGKEYEQALGEGGVPGTYLEYLDLLREVFGQCVQKLEPGGRMAVNVANLGRRPYRSLSADVIGILQDDLRLLLRGEIIWVKQRGSSGSCAWGSFQRPANPVLRDLTERVVVASKGRFDRALPARERARRQLPSESSLTREDFMEGTLDLWEIPPESATRVGHPAPFPVELPARLIDLYTYRADLVLDPFAGSGTTAVAAVRAGRHFAGYDLDPAYIKLAEQRVEAERQRLLQEPTGPRVNLPAATARRSAAPAGGDAEAVPAGRSAAPAGGDAEAVLDRARRDGLSAGELARTALALAGFADIRTDRGQPGAVKVDFAALDAGGGLWRFDAAGGFTTHRGGLKRTDTLWKEIAKAAVLHQDGRGPFVLLTTGVPDRGPAAEGLRRVVGAGRPVRAVIDLLGPAAVAELSDLCRGGAR